MIRIRTLITGGLSSTILIGALAGGTFAAPERIPVSSVDDQSLSISNRIAAVDHVVLAMGGRLDRIVASLPADHPPVPILGGLISTRSTIGTLIETIDAQVCNQDGVTGTGDSSLADADAFAQDSSSTGLLNQLSSVRGVLAEGRGRLIRIAGAYPAGPPVDEVRNALLTVRSDAVIAFETVNVRIDDGNHPPSPCVTT
ncbi:MAG TPA: hypothetical protein VHM48_01420 [Candidatus Limnocylindrales bacterium]|nr:hypothetical protein [Candidatus Limnocylindrales bacterium]